jgi:hypothetical protein
MNTIRNRTIREFFSNDSNLISLELAFDSSLGTGWAGLPTFTLDLAAMTSVASAAIPCSGSSRIIVANDVSPKNIAKFEMLIEITSQLRYGNWRLIMPEYGRQG